MRLEDHGDTHEGNSAAGGGCREPWPRYARHPAAVRAAQAGISSLISLRTPREMSVQLSLQVQLGSTNDSAGGDLFMDFSNYGAPVKIAAPVASDTISYKWFLQSLGAS
jgi:hypothetical protein